MELISPLPLRFRTAIACFQMRQKKSETSNIKGKDTHLAFSRCLFPSVVSGVPSILIPKQWKSLEPYTRLCTEPSALCQLV